MAHLLRVPDDVLGHHLAPFLAERDCSSLSLVCRDLRNALIGAAAQYARYRARAIALLAGEAPDALLPIEPLPSSPASLSSSSSTASTLRAALGLASWRALHASLTLHGPLHGLFRGMHRGSARGFLGCLRSSLRGGVELEAFGPDAARQRLFALRLHAFCDPLSGLPAKLVAVSSDGASIYEMLCFRGGLRDSAWWGERSTCHCAAPEPSSLQTLFFDALDGRALRALEAAAASDVSHLGRLRLQFALWLREIVNKAIASSTAAVAGGAGSSDAAPPPCFALERLPGARAPARLRGQALGGADAEAGRAKGAVSVGDLAGLWSAHYGGHGLELIHVAVEDGEADGEAGAGAEEGAEAGEGAGAGSGIGAWTGAGEGAALASSPSLAPSPQRMERQRLHERGDFRIGRDALVALLLATDPSSEDGGGAEDGEGGEEVGRGGEAAPHVQPAAAAAPPSAAPPSAAPACLSRSPPLVDCHAVDEDGDDEREAVGRLGLGGGGDLSGGGGGGGRGSGGGGGGGGVPLVSDRVRAPFVPLLPRLLGRGAHARPPPPPPPPRADAATATVACAFSCFAPPLARAALPLAARGVARLVARKVPGDANVPSGWVSFCANVGPTGARDVRAAVPAHPVLDLRARPPRLVNLDAERVAAAFEGAGVINRAASQFRPEHVPGTLLVRRPQGGEGGVELAFLWDADDAAWMPHLTTLTRVTMA